MLKRIDNTSIVVKDLGPVVAFFEEIGLEVEGKATVEGKWVDRVIALEGVVSDIVMMRTPDGHGKLELASFRKPTAIDSGQSKAPANALGIRRIMFTVDDIDDVVARLQKHGGELMGDVVQFEDTYRLCYMRGPEGIMIALAEELFTS